MEISTFVQIPENGALEGLAGALVAAWRLYNNPQSVILFLVIIPSALYWLNDIFIEHIFAIFYIFDENKVQVNQRSFKALRLE